MRGLLAVAVLAAAALFGAPAGFAQSGDVGPFQFTIDPEPTDPRAAPPADRAGQPANGQPGPAPAPTRTTPTRTAPNGAEPNGAEPNRAANDAAAPAPREPQRRVDAFDRIELGVQPFDINRDGRSPAIRTNDGTAVDPAVPSTTVSPLRNVRNPSRTIAVEAVSTEQRQDLNRLLKAGTDTVRELRVDVGADDAWVDSVVDRPIMPFRSLRLDGEIASRSWMVFLNGTEASRGATLSLAFTNSVLVLPEASRLRVFVNQRLVLETAIDSPDRTKVVAVPLSSEVLRAGPNAVRLVVDQRHRIDCSIGATYELWTRIDTRLTGLSFPGGRIVLSGLADLPAVGVGVNGATRIRVHTRGATPPARIQPIMRAIQITALRGRFSQPLVETVDLGSPPPVQPGVVNLVMGPYAEIAPIVPGVPSDGEVSPIVTLLDPPDLGPTVVVTGPNAQALDVALREFGAGIQPLGRDPRIAAIPPWLAPMGARVDGPGAFTLREAGVPTQEFSGRRFDTTFQVTLPPDFYAAAYGEAELLLNAAYSPDVLPGSRLNVRVNGILSTSISFTGGGGRVYDRFPIALIMRSFRPGINRVTIEAELNTETDAVCLPGGTVPTSPRFVLFNTTEMVFPEFARIGQLPNLAAFATNGFPYGRSPEPIALRLGGTSSDTFGAAATLLARVAVSRGEPLMVRAADQSATVLDRPTLVVAPLTDVDAITLEATGADLAIPGNWLTASTTEGVSEPQGLDRYEEVLRRLRQQQRMDDLQSNQLGLPEETTGFDRVTDAFGDTERLQRVWLDDVAEGGTIRQALGDLASWFRSQISFDFQIRDEEGPFETDATAAQDTTLILAQAAAPRNDRTAWTLVTAPTASMLSASMAAVAAEDTWIQVGGRLTAFQLENDTIQTIEAERVAYLATAPLSFQNVRLVAANWFSLNDGIYAIVLILAAVVLAIVTYGLVSRSGRRHNG